MSSEEIAHKILKSAAPGQFDAVAESLQKIGKGCLPGGWLAPIKAEHDVDMCIGVDNPTSHPIAESLREKLKAYQQETFGSKSNVNSRVAIAPGDTADALTVYTYAEKIDAANQFTGAWKATWTVTTNSDTSATILGVVNIHTYSYEDGNFQLRTEKDFDSTQVNSKGDTTLASALVDKIVDFEHQALDLLASLHDRTADNLRSIRRILPITKTRMKWDVVAHRNVKTLRVTAK